MAVATAYFLALNAVAAYFIVELSKTKERLRDAELELAAVRPQLRQVANVAGLLLDANSEILMSGRRPSES